MTRIQAVAGIAVVVLSTAAHAQIQPASPARLVTSGEGQTRVTPDRATISVGVQSRAVTVAPAAADNNRRQKAIIDTLRALGIPAEQIATQNYSVSPDMRYDPNGANPKVAGYIVTNTVRVELKRVDQVASVIDASLAKGANQVGGVQFGISNVADARRLAISDAVKSARADAEALAVAAGGSLGPLLELSSTGPSYRPMVASVEMQPSAMVRQPTPIEPGEQVVTASVSATWAFVPRPPR